MHLTVLWGLVQLPAGRTQPTSSGCVELLVVMTRLSLLPGDPIIGLPKRIIPAVTTETGLILAVVKNRKVFHGLKISYFLWVVKEGLFLLICSWGKSVN